METLSARKLEASRSERRRLAAVMVEDMVLDLGMTPVARHSEPRPTIAYSSSGEANVCTPRPTSSRVTTADGRSPGSRVVTLRRLPRTEISQWHKTKDSPLTVAGAATALGKIPRTAFPFDPQTGNRRDHLGLRVTGSQCHQPGRTGAVRFLFADACARRQSLRIAFSGMRLSCHRFDG